MPLTNITPLPALSRTDPNFKQDVDTFFGTQLPEFTIEVNELASQVEQLASQASSYANSSLEYATESKGYRDDSNSYSLLSREYSESSANYASQASAAANVLGSWENLTGPMSPPAAVWYNSRIWVLLQPISNVASQTPGLSPSYWAPVITMTNAKTFYFGSM